LQAGRSWGDWLAVGEAIQVGRHRAMIEANTNTPRGPRYESIFGDWLRETGFDTLDKGNRKRLLDCFQHRAEIETWRQTLPSNKRLQLNHPASIWRNWQKETVAGKATAEQPARLSPIAKFKQEVIRLENENLALRRAGDDLFSSKDSAMDIARLLADHLLQHLSPNKVRQIIEELPKIVAEREGLTRNVMTTARSARGKKVRRTAEEFQHEIAKRRKAAEMGTAS
jgi:hypothetical protein